MKVLTLCEYSGYNTVYPYGILETWMFARTYTSYTVYKRVLSRNGITKSEECLLAH